MISERIESHYLKRGYSLNWRGQTEIINKIKVWEARLNEHQYTLTFIEKLFPPVTADSIECALLVLS